MPFLDTARVAAAADAIATGSQVWRGLSYLGRARLKDIPALVEATRHKDASIRWRRLWVLCGVLARLARSPEGQGSLRAQLTADLAALNILARFEAGANAAAGRLLERLADALLPDLVDLLVTHRADPRRAPLFVRIVDRLAPDPERIHLALAPQPPEVTQAVVRLLPKRHGPITRRIDTAALGARLAALNTTGESA